MKRLFSLLLSVLLMTMIITPIGADDSIEYIEYENELIEAVGNSGSSSKVYYLVNDIELTKPLVISNNNMTLNLSQYSITAADDFSCNDNSKTCPLIRIIGNNISIVDGARLESGSKNPYTLSIEGASNTSLTNITLDNRNSEGGSPLYISDSDVSLAGRSGDDGSAKKYGNITFNTNSNVDSAITLDASGSVKLTTDCTNILVNNMASRPFIYVKEGNVDNIGVDLSKCYVISNIQLDVIGVSDSVKVDNTYNPITANNDNGSTNITMEDGTYKVEPNGNPCVYGMCGSSAYNPYGPDSEQTEELISWFSSADSSADNSVFTLDNSYDIGYGDNGYIIVNGNKTIDLNGYEINAIFDEKAADGLNDSAIAMIVINPGASLTIKSESDRFDGKIDGQINLECYVDTDSDLYTILNYGELVIEDDVVISISRINDGDYSNGYGIFNGSTENDVNGKEEPDSVDNSKITMTSNCTINAKTAIGHNLNVRNIAIESGVFYDYKVIDDYVEGNEGSTYCTKNTSIGLYYIVGQEKIAEDIAEIEPGTYIAKMTEYWIGQGDLTLYDVPGNITFRNDGGGNVTINGHKVNNKYVTQAGKYKSAVVVLGQDETIDGINNKLKDNEEIEGIDENTRKKLGEARRNGSEIYTKMTQDEANNNDVSKIKDEYGRDVIEAFDLSMEIIGNDGYYGLYQIGKVTDLGDEHIKVTVELDKSFVVADGKYYIATVHDDGNPEKIEATVEDGILTFSTSKFSTFVICLEGGIEETTETPSSPSYRPSTKPSKDLPSNTKECQKEFGDEYIWSDEYDACVIKFMIVDTSTK